MGARINGTDITRGKKRVNMSLSMNDFEYLFVVAECKRLPVTNLAQSWVIERAKEEYKKLTKSGAVNDINQYGLFEKHEKKRGVKRNVSAKKVKS